MEAHILRRYLRHHPHQRLGDGRDNGNAGHRLPSGERHTGGHRPVRENPPQPVHPFARTERLQLRQEESDHGRGTETGR